MYIPANFLKVNIQHADFGKKDIRFILPTFSATFWYYRVYYGSHQNFIKYSNIVKNLINSAYLWQYFLASHEGNFST